MSAWNLPQSLEAGGYEYEIRTDFRVILDILKYFGDPEYEPDEKWEICLDILYKNYEVMPAEHKEEALQKALWFIDMGMENGDKRRPRTMDWEQDASVIFPAVNKVMGKETRSMEYLHWWTFLGAYMEIGESLFSQVLNIRQKKASGKHLEKWENKFYTDNREICELKKKYSRAELKEQERMKAILDGR